jgi:hypothetical protein
MLKALRGLIGCLILILGVLLLLGMIAWDIIDTKTSWVTTLSSKQVIMSILWGLGCIGLIIAGLKIIRKK